MLEIRYKKKYKEKAEETRVESLYVKNKEPLLLKGNNKEITAFFQTIIKNPQIEFYLADCRLDAHKMHFSTLCLNDMCHERGHIRVRDYLLQYVKQENIQTYLQEFNLIDKQDYYVHQLSSDEKLLLKAFLAFYQRPYLLLIEGNWNLCSEVIQRKLHHMMHKHLQNGGYVILANTASCFYDCQEEYDITSDLPQAKPITNFLEEDLPLREQKVISIHRKKRWYDSYAVQILKYSCYAILCFCISSMLVGWLLNSQGMQWKFQTQLNTYEESKQFPLTINGVINRNQVFTYLNADSYQELAKRLTDVDWRPVQYFSLNFMNEGEPIYLVKEGKIINADDVQLESDTRGFVYIDEFEIKNRISEDYGVSGIYISKNMAERLGAKGMSLDGYSLHMTVYIPLYTSLSKDRLANYGDLAKALEVEVPVAGILSKNTNSYSSDLCDFFMTPSIYEQIRNQQDPDLDFYERQDIEEFHLHEYFTDDGDVVPYVPNTVKIYAESLAEASDISRTLAEGSIQFQTYNEGLTVKNQISNCKQVAKDIRDALLNYVLIAGVILLVSSLMLRYKQRRHLLECIENYASIKIWKRQLLIKAVIVILLVCASVWFLFAKIITYEFMQEVSTYAFTKTSYESMTYLVLLMDVLQLLLYINELPIFYVVIVLLSVCISLCIFAPEYIKYLRMQHKQHIVTKKIS